MEGSCTSVFILTIGALDIIATYQFVAARTPASTKQRATVWAALNQLLHRIPSRNNLICLGDYNCGLTAMPPWVGTTSFQWKGQMATGPVYTDKECLQGDPSGAWLGQRSTRGTLQDLHMSTATMHPESITFSLG